MPTQWCSPFFAAHDALYSCSAAAASPPPPRLTPPADFLFVVLGHFACSSPCPPLFISQILHRDHDDGRFLLYFPSLPRGSQTNRTPLAQAVEAGREAALVTLLIESSKVSLSKAPVGAAAAAYNHRCTCRAGEAQLCSSIRTTQQLTALFRCVAGRLLGAPRAGPAPSVPLLRSGGRGPAAGPRGVPRDEGRRLWQDASPGGSGGAQPLCSGVPSGCRGGRAHPRQPRQGLCSPHRRSRERGSEPAAPAVRPLRLLWRRHRRRRRRPPRQFFFSCLRRRARAERSVVVPLQERAAAGAHRARGGVRARPKGPQGRGQGRHRQEYGAQTGRLAGAARTTVKEEAASPQQRPAPAALLWD